MLDVIQWFLERVAEYSLASFSSWDRFWSTLWKVANTFSDLQSGLAWPYLLASFVIALAGYLFLKEKKALSTSSFAAFLLPRQIYFHPSAMLDYRFYIVTTLLKLLLWIPILGGIGLLAYKAMKMILIGYMSWEPPTTLPLNHQLCAVFGFYLLYDFANYCGHILFHRVPLLWSFHQVHHSAEVMTPITGYRAHPMEIFLTAFLQAPVMGLAAVFYQDVPAHDMEATAIFGVSIVSFMYGLSGYHLQHSHLPISYGYILNRLIVSPIQHQVHHSIDPRHHNMNFGVKFALWDTLFGTLYVPKRTENLRFGLPDLNPRDFSSVAKLYFLPFGKAMSEFIVVAMKHSPVGLSKTLLPHRLFIANAEQPQKIKSDS